MSFLDRTDDVHHLQKTMHINSKYNPPSLKEHNFLRSILRRAWHPPILHADPQSLNRTLSPTQIMFCSCTLRCTIPFECACQRMVTRLLTSYVLSLLLLVSPAQAHYPRLDRLWGFIFTLPEFKCLLLYSTSTGVVKNLNHHIFLKSFFSPPV